MLRFHGKSAVARQTNYIDKATGMEVRAEPDAPQDGRLKGKVVAPGILKSPCGLALPSRIVGNKPLHFNRQSRSGCRDKAIMPALGKFHDAHVGNPVHQIQQTRL